jgi:predicted benzoate:H+ symporter BenE
MSELGGFVGLNGVIAGGHCMLYTGSVSAFVALLGCSTVTLGGPFMVVCGGDV